VAFIIIWTIALSIYSIGYYVGLHNIGTDILVVEPGGRFNLDGNIGHLPENGKGIDYGKAINITIWNEPAVRGEPRPWINTDIELPVPAGRILGMGEGRAGKNLVLSWR
jgi:hypothetical protein